MHRVGPICRSHRYLLVRSLAAAILLWAAFPPLACWPLSIAAIAILMSIVVDEQALQRRDFWHLWLSGFFLWLALLQGIRLAFWPLYFGWIALAAYLAIYTPCFVMLARSLHHRWRWPLALAATAAWETAELVRGYFATGFSGCLLGHCVAKQPILTQTASQLGPYAVGAVIVLAGVVAWNIFAMIRTQRRGSLLIETMVAGGMIALHVGYGFWELARSKQLPSSPLFTAALLQENAPTVFEVNPERARRAWDSYLEQTRLAGKQAEVLDLVVWPESIFTREEPIIDWDKSTELPSSLVERGWTFVQLGEIVESFRQENRDKISKLQAAVDSPENRGRTHFLVGCDVHRIRGRHEARLNAAAWFTPDGQLSHYYAKQHLVMFGEYIPILNLFPDVNDSLGLPRATAGQESIGFELPTPQAEEKVARIVPSICFENVVPHLIGRQIAEIEAEGKQTQVLVNITNDGWFRGSSISDIHLNNAIFASVENRRPMLIAANVGLTAWIDGSGVVQQIAERNKPAVVIAQPTRDNRAGLWQKIGDWPFRLLSLAVLALFLWPRRLPFTFRSKNPSSP